MVNGRQGAWETSVPSIAKRRAGLEDMPGQLCFSKAGAAYFFRLEIKC